MLLQRHNSRICRKRRKTIQSDGQVAWQWAYSAFGEEKPTTAKTRFANADLNQSFGTTTVPAVTFNLRYPGQYFDLESGLHSNYHRSYSATTGRYTQSDPIGLDGGWNRFGYVEQNPFMFIDPLGQNTITGGAAIGGAIAGPPGAIVGGLLGFGALVLIDKFCKPDDKCDPPEGTICSEYHEKGTPHKATDAEGNSAGLAMPHVHTWQQNKKPDGTCQWNKRKATKYTFSDFTPLNARACSSYPSWNSQEGK